MPEYPKLYEWQIPPAAMPDDRKLAWVNSATEEGQAWVRNQRGYGDWRRALDAISGRLSDDVPAYRSQLRTNHLKRNVREIVGTLSKIRPLWIYNSDNSAYQQQAETFNKVTKAIFLESSMGRSIKEALCYAAATCSGYVRPVYQRDMASGKGKIELLTYGQPCILPVQMPASGNLQKAYAVTIMDEMPIYMAHAMFPLKQEQLRPTNSSYWYSSEIRRSATGNMFKRIWNAMRPSDAGGQTDLLCPIRYTYVIDLTMNTTDHMIPMGEPGTSWYYEVPGYGTMKADGSRANEQDARLYPYRRLMISSDNVICYDGPSFDWHGMLPLGQFTTDRWPWEPIGFSLTRDGFDLQLAIDESMRGMADKFRVQNDMPLSYDFNSVTKKEANQFDPMQPRARIGFDGTNIQAPFGTPIPPEVLVVKQEQIAFVNLLKEQMNEQHAISDALALAKARLSGDDLEKVLEANGPIIEEMSASMEAPLTDVGNMLKYLILQYLPTSRVMQYVGADGISTETLDMKPDQMIPSHMPGENKNSPSVYSNMYRARYLADILRLFITPGSVHELTQMSMKLGLVQLKKAGVMVSSETIASAWNLRNYGHLDGNTEIDKWKSEQEIQIEFAARMKALGSQLDGSSGLAIPGLIPPEAIADMPPAALPRPQFGAPVMEGRPPSGHASPQLVSKDGGLRSTITES